MIRFPCPKCGREFAVDNCYTGRLGTCSWCGMTVTVPEPYAEGTMTDESRDPELLTSTAFHEPNPFRLPEYKEEYQNLVKLQNESVFRIRVCVFFIVSILVLLLYLMSRDWPKMIF